MRTSGIIALTLPCLVLLAFFAVVVTQTSFSTTITGMAGGGGCEPTCDVHEVCDTGTCVVLGSGDPCQDSRDCSVSTEDCYNGDCTLYCADESQDCQTGYTCNTVTNRCVQCTSDAHCPGRVCDTSSNTCVDCISSSNCETGYQCQSNSCTPICASPKPYYSHGTCYACISDNHCLQGQICTNDNCAVKPECTSDNDCSGGYVCQEGTCIAPPDIPCESNNECGSGEICQNGICVVQQVNCGGNGIANPNYPAQGDPCLCFQGYSWDSQQQTCTIPAPVASCPLQGGNPTLQYPHPNQVGLCVACFQNSHCSSPTAICDTATYSCVQCTSNSQCAQGETCSGNTCVTAPTPTQTGCTSNDDCPGKVCDTATGACVACLTTTDCSTGTCINNQCTTNQNLVGLAFGPVNYFNCQPYCPFCNGELNGCGIVCDKNNPQCQEKGELELTGKATIETPGKITPKEEIQHIRAKPKEERTSTQKIQLIADDFSGWATKILKWTLNVDEREDSFKASQSKVVRATHTTTEQ